MKLIIQLLVAVVFILSCSKEVPRQDFDSKHSRPGAGSQKRMIYSMSNDAAQNMILAFSQQNNGAIQLEASYAARGGGSGTSLQSQGSLTILNNWLFAVNAGTNTIASFEILNNGTLRFADTIDAGGALPVSITAFQNRVYVVNAGSSSISGYYVNNQGIFSVISNSGRALSKPNAMPAQISFTPNGQMLVVTESAANTVTCYLMDGSGRPYPPSSYLSSGETPGGFCFVGNYIVMSQAKNNVAEQGTVSSYNAWGVGYPISGPLCAQQTGTSRVAAYEQIVYALNPGSNSISSFVMDKYGALELKEKMAAATGNGPSAIAVHHDAKTLYQVNSGSRSMSGYKIAGNFALSKAGEITGLPPAASGLATY